MKDATKAVIAGRDPHANFGVVNPPVYRASTILSPTLADRRASRAIAPGDGVTYGIHGTPGTFAFEEAVRALEGGFRTRLCASGLTAVTAPLLCCTKAGDHVLMPDAVYAPSRTFADGMLARMGVTTTYYDPLIGGGIEALLRPNTSVVLVESPCTWTFEVQDVPAIADAAHRAGAIVMMDNTWASPLYFKAFEHGVDISIQAATKYIAGHSDLLMGTVTANEATYPLIQKGWQELGLCAGPDDVYLAMRGIRTIATRLKQQEESGLRVAHWLAGREEVAHVMHPAMEHDPGHALWKRDFLGASSLFGFILREDLSQEPALAALLDGLALYGMGSSWGGYESLLIPVEPERQRTVTAWPREGIPRGQVMRIHIGLEDTDDLIADLEAGFDRLRQSRVASNCSGTPI
ncbi:MAG: cystathionine beta-lyase [Pseudomonadota bacterium]